MNGNTKNSSEITTDMQVNAVTDAMAGFDISGGGGGSNTLAILPHSAVSPNMDEDQPSRADESGRRGDDGQWAASTSGSSKKLQSPLREGGGHICPPTGSGGDTSSPAKGGISTPASETVDSVFRKEKKKFGKSAAKSFFPVSEKKTTISENNKSTGVTSSATGAPVKWETPLPTSNWKVGQSSAATAPTTCKKQLHFETPPLQPKIPSSTVSRQQQTPRTRSSKIISWEGFCIDVNMTPFHEEKTTINEVIATGERILRIRSCGEIGWDDIRKEKKAMMALVMNDGIYHFFETEEDFEHTMYGVLTGDDTYAIYAKNLWPFVRKGGDAVDCRTGQHLGSGLLAYHHHLSQFPELFAVKNVKWASIFTGNVEPTLKYQEPHSMVCVFLVLSLTIYYCQCKRQGRDNPLDDKSLSMNISKCLRYRLTSRQKFQTIFKFNGCTLQRAIDCILRGDNPKREHFFNSVEFNYDCDLDDLYSECQRALKSGNLILLGFRTYPGYRKSAECYRDINDHKEFDATGHAVIITDVLRTADGDKFGGFVFVLQECCEVPFKNLGINLVLQQNIREICYLLKNVNLPKDDIFDISPDYSMTACGASEGTQMPAEPEIDLYEAYYKRGGIFQQNQHMFTNDPNAIAPWDRRNYQNHGDENRQPSSPVSCHDNHPMETEDGF